MDEKRPIRSPPDDPNRTRNRLPSHAELATLHNIRLKKRKLVDYTKQELDVAREEHERIQRRYDEILREMNSIQSELNISYDYLVTLEKQLEVFQVEDERLTGLLHPVRRCPEEILVLIFESAQLARTEHFKFPTCVSQVCRNWRAAALTTSSLWAEIDVSMNRNIDDIKIFMERCRIRLGLTIPNIWIRHIRERPVSETEAIMQAVGLVEFKNVEILTYVLDTSNDVTQLTHSAFAYSPSSVQHLYIHAESKLSGSPPWDCGCLLKLSPNLKILELESLGSVTLGGDDSSFELRELRLSKLEVPEMRFQLPRYQSLTELILYNGAFALQPLLQDFTLPMLCFLEYTDDINVFPWDRLTTPRLRKLITNDPSRACRAFISRHSSILNLRYDVWTNEDEFNAFVRSLGRLEVLSVGGSIGALFRQADAETPFPSFPKLKELTIDTRENHPLSVQDFGDFTRLRCLPRQSQAQGDGVERVMALSILIPTSDLSSALWRKSPLMVHWKETITKDTEDVTVTTIYLVPAE